MSLYIHVEYTGDWWGEDPLHETDHETTGDLFRALSGKDHTRPWEALGRCTGRVYIDTDDGTKAIGWVFVARNPEPVNRGDEQPTGLRVAWVTVHEQPPTRTVKYHYAKMGRAA